MGLCASTDRNSGSAKKLRMSFFPSKTDKHRIPIPSTPNEHELEKTFDPPSINSIGFRSQVSPLNTVPCYGSYGSKEETFFDSQAWLDSDCDDDFYSVRGDFTPSCGSTPVHGSAAGAPLVNKAFLLQASRTAFEGKPPPLNCELKQSRCSPQANTTAIEGKAFGSSPDSSSLSSTDKTKKLLELFRDSRADGEGEELTILGHRSDGEANWKLESKLSIPKSVDGMPYLSSTNSVSSGGRTPSGDSDKPVKAKPLRSSQCCFPRLVSSCSLHERKKPMAPPIAVDA
ncbi:hypothetical protein Nepgr_025710 [Nepenthes gracilis]|uniref:Uncharacterized protein n=1 Tax=Nepenthes gracilis TaxID=150966 RepID=A0AAD3T8A2_NEPGR|nr:hypothetical protein Nepgr_025710 [Nepenthes gracilis]